MSVGGTLGELPSIAIFNVAERVYLPLPPELASLKGKAKAEVLPRIEQLLWVPKFVRVSEPVPVDQNRPYVKLVGTTDGTFVAQQVTVLVLYVPLVSAKTEQYLSAFTLAAERATGKNVQFGVINATANAASHASLSSVPWIIVFLSNDKAHSRPVFGRPDPDAIHRFASKYAIGPVAELVATETKRDHMFEVLNIWKQNHILGLSSSQQLNTVFVNYEEK
jgi:hypothetical protein